MLQPNIGELHTRQEVGEFQTEKVSIHIPSKSDCPDCGFDEFTQSAKDISCTTCKGKGKVTNWLVSSSSARVMWIDEAAPVWGAVASGEVGDVWLSVRLAYKSMYDKVKDVDGAYIYVDERTVKPISIEANTVAGRSSLDVRCAIIKV